VLNEIILFFLQVLDDELSRQVACALGIGNIATVPGKSHLHMVTISTFVIRLGLESIEIKLSETNEISVLINTINQGVASINEDGVTLV
jgi:hypothetical protein